MNDLKIKLAVAGVVFACAVGYLAFAGVQKGWVYTVTVDHYLANPQQQTQRVRLGGTVSPQDLQINKAQLTAHFLLKGEKDEIPVDYKGVIPDLFKPGCQVLVEGKRDAAGVFQSDLMMTKCASKYDAAPQGHPASEASAALQTAGGAQ